MAGSLADRYQKRLEAAAKRGKSSFRVTRNGKKSSAINQGTVDAIRGDEAGNVIILENNAKLIEEAIQGAVAAALEEIGLVAEGYAKRLCPVDTGRLRNSITHAIGSVDDLEVYVGTNVEYAPYVENGIHGRDGVHFLRSAAQDHGDRYRSILKKHLENA